MASLVAAKCPNCGAGLRVDTDQEVVTCGYCHTSAFVKTRSRPVTQEIARRHRAIIDTTRSSTAWLFALGLGVLTCVAAAAVFARQRASVPPAPATLHEQASEPNSAPTTKSAEAPSPPSPTAEQPTSPEKVSRYAVLPTASGAAGTPRVRMGATTVSGRLPPEIVQRIVRQNYGRFRMCYEQSLARSPTLAGRVAVRFVIGRDGGVSNVSDAGSDLPDSAMVSCVKQAFYGLSFPKPEIGIVTVVYPVLFSR